MILVTGAAGQLGTDVITELKGRNIKYIGIDVVGDYGIDILDITDEKAVSDYIKTKKPLCVIHTAAYTAVDKAEDEQDACYKINVKGTENLASVCKEIDAEMIYISTDYVFAGKGNQPYEIDAIKAPLSVYGKSKLAGEKIVKEYIKKYYIVRISGVFGKHGNNFIKTMLRLAEKQDSINVVNDQIGSPTYTEDLSILLCDMVLSEKYGEYHATNEGYCSWAEFASKIMELSGRDCKINPIPSKLYPTKAKRPKNWRLSKKSLDESGFNRLPGWQDALKRFL